MITKNTIIDLYELIDAANGEGFSAKQMAGIALCLSKQRKAIDEALEVVKTKLRKQAVNMKEDDKNHVNITGEFQTTQEGFIQITFMEPSLKLKRGVKPEDIPQSAKLFSKKTTYVPVKNIIQLAKELDINLFEYFDLIEPTPRVGFRTNK